MRQLLLLIPLCFILTGCYNNVANNPVPNRPVQLAINTQAGIFVHFRPENTTSYVIVDPTGYHYLSQTLPLSGTDMYGYAGVVVFVTNNQTYAAFDLCCPHCVSKLHPCEIDGIFAECPLCGEQYDLSFGYGQPCKGISKYALRQYYTFYSNYRLTIHN